MTTLILVRHGESEANSSGIFAGHLDVELQERGFAQAKKTAVYIKENYNISKVFASDLKRAYKTGECIAEVCGVEITANENLREINAGKWEGLTFSELHEKYKDSFGVWCTDIGNAVCVGGESVVELAERIENELIKLAEENDGQEIVIVTHATPVRAMQCMTVECAVEGMKDIPWVSNASVTEIRYKEGKCKLVKVGEDTHLSKLKTELPANV